MSELTSDNVANAIAGDADALERLLHAVEPELRAALKIQPIWKRSLDVDDVLQVTYLEAFLRCNSLQDDSVSGFRAWIKRLATNNMADAIRALERDKRPDARRRVTHGPAGQSARTLFEALGGHTQTAGGQAALAEQVERLERAIERLPKSYRQVVREVDLAERPVVDVAAELGKSPGSVHLLRARARARLGELLSRPLE